MKQTTRHYYGVPLKIRVDGRKVGHSITKKARRKIVDVQVGMLHFGSESSAKRFIRELSNY